MFGLTVPESVKAEKGEPVRYWGARAILNSGSGFDLLNDRKTQNFPEADYKKMKKSGAKSVPFVAWLDSILAQLQKKSWSPSSEEVVTFTEGGYTLMASPKASYGYLYIGAWEYEEKAN